MLSCVNSHYRSQELFPADASFAANRLDEQLVRQVALETMRSRVDGRSGEIYMPIFWDISAM